ncbi:hypothetical protein [Xanthomonas oryzae]|nr:hypothetical protein V1208_05860 [Xanthomonas oryzae pv. oryzicola]
MAAWHWAGFAISWEVLQLKVRANQVWCLRGFFRGDYVSPVWGALSIAGFLYIRRRLIRLTASSQEEDPATTNTSNADRIN